MAKLDDNSEMPFGKHKGMKMIDVPASYLLWLYDNDLKDGNVKDYIEDIGIETIKKEKEKENE